MSRFAILLFFYLPALACPPGDLESLSGEPVHDYEVPFQAQKRITLEKLRKKISDLVDIEVRVMEDPSKDWEKTMRVYAIRSSGEREPLDRTHLDFDISGGVLSSHVNVGEKYRDAGLNRLMHLRALQENPSVRANKVILGDSNQAAMVTAMASEETDPKRARELAERYERSELSKDQTNRLFIDELVYLTGKKRIQAYRDRLVNAYFENTPAGRLNRTNGFRRIKYIDIRLGDDIEITLLAEKGEPDPAVPPRVIVSDHRKIPTGQFREMFPDGGYRRLRERPKLD